MARPHARQVALDGALTAARLASRVLRAVLEGALATDPHKVQSPELLASDSFGLRKNKRIPTFQRCRNPLWGLLILEMLNSTFEAQNRLVKLLRFLGRKFNGHCCFSRRISVLDA